MKFTATEIEGVHLLDVEPISDARGFFARCWCRREFAERGLLDAWVQANIAASRTEGTLRGVHYQADPDWEEKLVRCTRGAAFVVAVDLRRDSATHCRWVGVELTAENHRMLYVPRGCAQGYQTLTGGTEMFYQMSRYYAAESGRGVRFDDPAFGIAWPLPISAISDADRNWPEYTP